MNEQLKNVPIKNYLYQVSAQKGIPLCANFEVSPICNFNCKMCYIHQTPSEVAEHDRPMMTLEEWKRLAEQAKTEGTLYVLITGGEPLLWPDFWNLYEYLINAGFLVSVNTNGSLIDEGVVQKFVKYPPNRINITLYGASDTGYCNLCGITGAYNKVVKAIEMLTENHIPVKLNCSLTQDNISDLHGMLDFAKDHKLQITPTTYMFPPVRTKAEMFGENHRFTPEMAARYRMDIIRYLMPEDLYCNYLKSIGSGLDEYITCDDEYQYYEDGRMQCMAGKASYWVTWDGYLSLCGMLPGFKVDTRTDTFGNLWNELKCIGKGINVSGKCGNCKNKKICHSCAAISYAETGRTNGTPVYLCRMVDEIKSIALNELKVNDKNNNCI